MTATKHELLKKVRSLIDEKKVMEFRSLERSKIDFGTLNIQKKRSKSVQNGPNFSKHSKNVQNSKTSQIGSPKTTFANFLSKLDLSPGWSTVPKNAARARKGTARVNARDGTGGWHWTKLGSFRPNVLKICGFWDKIAPLTLHGHGKARHGG